MLCHAHFTHARPTLRSSPAKAAATTTQTHQNTTEGEFIDFHCAFSRRNVAAGRSGSREDGGRGRPNFFDECVIHGCCICEMCCMFLLYGHTFRATCCKRNVNRWWRWCICWQQSLGGEFCQIRFIVNPSCSCVRCLSLLNGAFGFHFAGCSGWLAADIFVPIIGIDDWYK